MVQAVRGDETIDEDLFRVSLQCKVQMIVVIIITEVWSYL